MKRRTFIKTLLLGSGALICGPKRGICVNVDSKTIKFVMLYNNYGSFDHYTNGWGISIWSEDKDTAVLFDTGGDSSVLWNNINASGFDIDKLSNIVISHNHWDHLGGLPGIIEKMNIKPDVFVPISDLESIKNKVPNAKIIGVKDPIQINEYSWSTGQLTDPAELGVIHEQACIITQNHSMYLLTGCSHFGIVETVEKAKKIHPDKNLNLIIGGFHLRNPAAKWIYEISDDLKKLGVKKLAPSHCTGKLAIKIFKDEWKENYIDFNLGNTMNI